MLSMEEINTTYIHKKLKHTHTHTQMKLVCVQWKFWKINNV